MKESILQSLHNTGASSFFAAFGNTTIDPNAIADNLSWPSLESDTSPYITILSESSQNVLQLDRLTIRIFGRITNEKIIDQHFNIDMLSLLQGNFAVFISDEPQKIVHLYISLTGNIPAYIIRTETDIFITSQLGAFRGTNYFKRELIPPEQYQYAYSDKTPQDFSFMQNCKRAIPGVLYSFSISEKPKLAGQKMLKKISPGEFTSDKKMAKQKLSQLLEQYIYQNSHTDETVAVPLSGGVDSGTIAGILSQHNKLHTFTIGTEFGNEYEKARLSADFCHAQHTELFMNESDFWEGMLHSVYYNEICDPLYAEGLSAFYHIFKHGSAVSQKFFTGYGADLLLGNIFKAEPTRMNEVNASWCRRTSWTGELSPYLPASMNCEMVYPFWSEDMMDLCLSLPSEFLQNALTEKLILRELSEEKKWSHPDIAWNKKTALNHGTSLDKVFAKLLEKENSADYSAKSRFLYFLFEAIFVSDKNINDIDLHELIRKTNTK